MKITAAALAVLAAALCSAVPVRAEDAPAEGKPKAAEKTPDKPAKPGKKPGVTGEAAGDENRTFGTVNAVMRRYAPLFKNAHKKLLQSDPKATGAMIIEFTVKPDGSVTGAKTIASDFSKHPAFEKEILEKAQKAKFIPIEKGDAKVVFPIAFGEE